jgi:sulfatase modifying factor 1
MKLKTVSCSLVVASLLLMSFNLKGKKNPLGLPRFFIENFAEIPSGKVLLQGETREVSSFYISNHEVTNLEYAEFVHYVKKSGDVDLLAKVEVDSTGWRIPNAYCEPYVTYYHNHPAYENYPVVNVSHQAAQAYCDWLTQFNKAIFEKNNPGLEVIYKLPDHASWKRAADGNHADPVYSWAGVYLENAKGSKMANFNTLGAEHIYFNEESGKYEVLQPGESKYSYQPRVDNYDVTAPVLSYPPSDFGVYNLNGNVAEMIDVPGIAVGGSWKSAGYDIRNESIMRYEKPNPMVGFRVMAIVKQKN